MLKITNLSVQTISGKPILKEINLIVKTGEVHTIMGPNGAGKSTLASSLMGHPDYVIKSGTINLDKKDLTTKNADKRAKAGLFLAFQYPIEIPGVTVSNFLKTAYDSLNKTTTDIIEFRTILKTNARKLKLSEDFIDRGLNENFSGGEKKKMEMLQLITLQPKYAIFDETDSGLDVDALKLVGQTINSIRETTGILLITHYHRILKYVQPDFVHIMVSGQVVKSGDFGLAEEIEEKGYERLTAG